MLTVDRVTCRRDAIWPFTVVGRPPQEDTMFGQLIHEITGPVIPTLIPGVHAVHAVDAAGVHPLLLAIGSERYTPFDERRRPQELLTTANAILGQGQLSLAKYLWIAAREDDDRISTSATWRPCFATCSRGSTGRATCTFKPRRRSTRSTIPATRLNEGSKVVIAAVGRPVRQLPGEIESLSLPEGFRSRAGRARPACWSSAARNTKRAKGPTTPWSGSAGRSTRRPPSIASRWSWSSTTAEFAARTLNDFLWVTFTRSNPAADVYGIGAFTRQKHWGCRGSLVIDARAKPQHAPPLVEDREITRRVDALGAAGGPLAGII